MTVFILPQSYGIFVIGEVGHFEFRVLIDAKEYDCIHDILLPKGVCLESRDLFKFWEISDNISETVQNGTIANALEWP